MTNDYIKTVLKYLCPERDKNTLQSLWLLTVTVKCKHKETEGKVHLHWAKANSNSPPKYRNVKFV